MEGRWARASRLASGEGLLGTTALPRAGEGAASWRAPRPSLPALNPSFIMIPLYGILLGIDIPSTRIQQVH